MSFEATKKEYEKQIDKLAQEAMSFPWEDKEAYAYWLAQTYYFVRRSTRLISFAGSLFSLEQNKLHNRFIDHVKEERGHENLATSDLKALNYDIKNLPELSQTSGFYQSQYYWILNYGPETFFGYFLCLEGIAVHSGAKVLKTVLTAHGEKASRFLKVHSEEDIGHIEQALEGLAAIPEDKIPFVMKNLSQCCAVYASMLQEIKRITNKDKKSYSKVG